MQNAIVSDKSHTQRRLFLMNIFRKILKKAAQLQAQHVNESRLDCIVGNVDGKYKRRRIWKFVILKIDALLFLFAGRIRISASAALILCQKKHCQTKSTFFLRKMARAPSMSERII